MIPRRGSSVVAASTRGGSSSASSSAAGKSQHNALSAAARKEESPLDAKQRWLLRRAICQQRALPAHPPRTRMPPARCRHPAHPQQHTTRATAHTRTAPRRCRAASLSLVLTGFLQKAVVRSLHARLQRTENCTRTRFARFVGSLVLRLLCAAPGARSSL